MDQTIQRYLNRCTHLDQWPLSPVDPEGLDRIVVIPVLQESTRLFTTLAGLEVNDPAALERTLVICIVNNRAPSDCDPAAIEDNARVLRQLAARAGQSPLRLAYIDASSPGRELPPKEGVGLARKIGLDWGLRLLAEARPACGLLLSLDADVRVQPDYLAAVHEAFVSRGLWAGVVDYAHPIDGTGQETAAIVCYELFLRYYVLGLRYAGSPYAFHSIGSTMACREKAYVAISGMNRRQAGEDFYFLQQLAKTGGIGRIDGTTVMPSSRASKRVPFGTGARVARFCEDSRNEYLLYHPASYRILRDWLRAVEAAPEDSAEALLRASARIDPELHRFLDAAGFARTWSRLQANSPHTKGLLEQFHRWFDGFKSLKLLHHLRDHGYPEQEMFGAISDLLAQAGWEGAPPASEKLRDDLPGQKELLCALRHIDRAQP